MDASDEKEMGPSVESDDPEERIQARRIRIQKRIEASRRAELGGDLGEAKDVKKELSKSRKQMEETRLRLTKLMDYGTELVTSIRVAGDDREVNRRIEEEDTRRQRNEKKDAEDKAGQERFEEITKKWESALQKEIPQDLHEMLMQQKAACDAMIDEKNKLITDFQMELKMKDNQYVKDLSKQADDVDLLINRMDQQVKELMKAFRDELNQVEKAFVAERTELLDSQKSKWEGMMSDRREKEEEFMKARERRVEDYEQQLQHLRVQDAEEYNRVKVKLETDVQLLEQQLQQMKATYQLNQEKLEYNFQVLRKRDEENMITKSAQKRKTTRLQDVLTNLKAKLAKQEKQYRDENQMLTSDYKKITEQFKELQKKSNKRDKYGHFMGTDSRKFNEVWCMNEEEAKRLAQRILDEDRVICEQQLGIPWVQPDVTFLENVGPIMSEQSKAKAVSAKQVLREVMSVPGEAGDGGGEVDMHSDSQYTDREGVGPLGGGEVDSKPRFSARLIKQILELLGDEGGFLIEEKLNKLLQPLDHDEQSLMRLDAIFSALGIETEEDIHLLSSYFLQSKSEETSEETDPVALDESRGPVDQQQAAAGRGKDNQQLMESSRSVRSDARHEQQLIHPNVVYQALRKFVEDNRHPPPRQHRQSQWHITSLEKRDDSDDAAYWQSYPDILTEKQERLWDALIDGLEKYSEILQSRASLITETDSLRQQNAELRMLLHQYVNSKVNTELEIPPTKVLQLELNPH